MLGPIFERHSDTIGKGTQDWEILTLTIFLMHEKQLGDSSFWAPYIDQLPAATFFCFAETAVILATRDMELVCELQTAKELINKQYRTVYKILSQYPQVFSAESLTKQSFLLAFAQVCTRDFGYYLPETCLIPMGDNHNHSDRDACTYDFVVKDLHLRAEPNSDYFKQERFMSDYSLLYSSAELE